MSKEDGYQKEVITIGEEFLNLIQRLETKSSCERYQRALLLAEDRLKEATLWVQAALSDLENISYLGESLVDEGFQITRELTAPADEVKQ